MTEQAKITADARPRMKRRTADMLAVGVAFAAYFVVFTLTRDKSYGEHLLAALRNVLPLALLAAGTRALIERHVVGRPFARQFGAHAGLAVLFTVGWYWLLTVAGGLMGGRSVLEFTVAPFLLGQALEWQLFQGLAVYVAVAALSHLGARPAVPVVVAQVAEDAPEPPREIGLQRYFIRVGEDIVPVDVSDIVSIAGADDYAQVTTTGGSHLARMTLAEFEASLDPARFLRVHRSRIVNLGCVVRAEPVGGGRLLLHMTAGESVEASRAGAKLLRDQVF